MSGMPDVVLDEMSNTMLGVVSFENGFNRSVLDDMEKIKVPDGVTGNSMATGTRGFIAILGADRVLKVTNFRSSRRILSDVHVHVHEPGVERTTLTSFPLATNVEFSPDGKILVLWGPEYFRMVNFTMESFLTCPSDVRLGSHAANIDEYLSHSHYTVKMIRWHPRSDNHLYILLLDSDSISGRLLIINTRTGVIQDFEHLQDFREKKGESILTSFKTLGSPFVSFTFGADISWLRFTVFFASENGSIHALCPVIPDGLILAAEDVAMLWATADRPSDRKFEEDLRNYMNGAFGHKYSSESKSIKLKDPALTKTDHVPMPRQYLPLLRSTAAICGRPSGAVTDISSDYFSPILMLAFDDGRVEILAVDGDILPFWRISDYESSMSPLTLIETISTDRRGRGLLQPLQSLNGHVLINADASLVTFLRVDWTNMMRGQGDVRRDGKIKVCLPKTVAVSVLSVPSTNLVAWAATSIPVLGTILLFRLSDGNVVFKSANRVVELETYRSTVKEKFANGSTSMKSFQSNLLENNFSGAYDLVRERLDKLKAEGKKLQGSQSTNISNEAQRMNAIEAYKSLCSEVVTNLNKYGSIIVEAEQIQRSSVGFQKKFLDFLKEKFEKKLQERKTFHVQDEDLRKLTEVTSEQLERFTKILSKIDPIARDNQPDERFEEKLEEAHKVNVIVQKMKTSLINMKTSRPSPLHGGVRSTPSKSMDTSSSSMFSSSPIPLKSPKRMFRTPMLRAEKQGELSEFYHQPFPTPTPTLLPKPNKFASPSSFSSPSMRRSAAKHEEFSVIESAPLQFSADEKKIFDNRIQRVDDVLMETKRSVSTLRELLFRLGKGL